jgi:hypothetical protein
MFVFVLLMDLRLLFAVEPKIRVDLSATLIWRVNLNPLTFQYSRMWSPVLFGDWKFLGIARLLHLLAPPGCALHRDSAATAVPKTLGRFAELDELIELGARDVVRLAELIDRHR